MFEKIVGERNLDRSRYTLDPFIRGTTVDGKFFVATRASGVQIPVAKTLSNGTIKATAQGENYFRDNRNEFTVHLPVWENYPRYSPAGVFEGYQSY